MKGSIRTLSVATAAASWDSSTRPLAANPLRRWRPFSNSVAGKPPSGSPQPMP